MDNVSLSQQLDHPITFCTIFLGVLRPKGIMIVVILPFFDPFIRQVTAKSLRFGFITDVVKQMNSVCVYLLVTLIIYWF